MEKYSTIVYWFINLFYKKISIIKWSANEWAYINQINLQNDDGINSYLSIRFSSS
jgi:hypothetical protein